MFERTTMRTVKKPSKMFPAAAAAAAANISPLKGKYRYYRAAAPLRGSAEMYFDGPGALLPFSLDRCALLLGSRLRLWHGIK